jgi:hypothetical protein
VAACLLEAKFRHKSVLFLLDVAKTPDISEDEERWKMSQCVVLKSILQLNKKIYQKGSVTPLLHWA